MKSRTEEAENRRSDVEDKLERVSQNAEQKGAEIKEMTKMTENIELITSISKEETRAVE